MNKIEYILLKSNLELKTLAGKIREVLNFNSKNKRVPILDQERYGLNHGGHYFLFENMGVEVYLIGNRGEVVLDGYEKYDYYMYLTLQFSFDDSDLLKELTNYIALILSSNNISSKVISE